MIQPLPRVISGVGYGDANQELGILDGNTSGVFVGRYAPMPIAGSVRSLSLYRPAGLPAVTVEIYIEGVATGITVTLGTGATQGHSEGDAPYNAGDWVTYKIATTLQLFPGFDMGLCAEIETDALCFGVAAISGGGAFLAPFYGGALGNGYWAENRSSQSINALSGSVTRIAMRRLTTNVGGRWKAWVEKGAAGTTPVLQDGSGGTVDSLCELVDGDPAFNFRDINVPCTPGEYVNHVLLRITEPTFAVEQVGVSIAFTPDTPGQFMMCGGSNDVIWSTATTSWKWNHSKQTETPIEKHTAPVGQHLLAIVGMYVEHTDFPGSGQSYTDTILRNGAPSDVAVVITGPATRFGNDTGREVYSPGDLLTIELTRTASAATDAKFYWGIAAEVITSGSIVVEKVAPDDPDQDFDIVAGGGLYPEDITLRDGEDYTFEDVEEGDGYSLEETLPAGWAQTGVTVSNDPSNNDPTNITVAAGETVVVTFTNARLAGRIIVEKVAPDDPDRTFTILAGGGLDPTSLALADGESYVFEDVEPGTYSLAEMLPAGWEVSAVVSNDSPLEAITVAAGEEVRVTFTNSLAECECCVATQISLINQALLKLGHSMTIEALDDATREAVTAGLIWTSSLRATLRRFPWAFATKYASAEDDLAGYLNLVGGSTSEPYNVDWTFAYRYPIDCLFARRLVNAGTKQGFDPNPYVWRVGRDADGWLIFTDVENAVLEYTALIVCDNDFADDLFEDALSWLLASKLAPSLARNKMTSAECLQLFEDRIAVAATVNVKERQLDHPGEAEWIRNRE